MMLGSAVGIGLPMALVIIWVCSWPFQPLAPLRATRRSRRPRHRAEIGGSSMLGFGQTTKLRPASPVASVGRRRINPWRARHAFSLGHELHSKSLKSRTKRSPALKPSAA